MVTKYGFSIIGPLSLESSSEISIGDGFVRNKSIIADNTYSRIDNEIINISKISLNNAINILNNNRILLEKLVELLLITETVENNIFKKITFDLLKV
jgi:cell division protease FtsH